MKDKNIKLNSLLLVPLAFVNFSLACIYQSSCVSILEPRQSNLSNPEAYSGPCQTSMVDCFAKIEND